MQEKAKHFRNIINFSIKRFPRNVYLSLLETKHFENEFLLWLIPYKDRKLKDLHILKQDKLRVHILVALFRSV